MQGEVSLQLTCTSGNRALVKCQNSASLKYSPQSKVLQLHVMTKTETTRGAIQWLER